jgi:hypothetical protein
MHDTNHRFCRFNIALVYSKLIFSYPIKEKWSHVNMCLKFCTRIHWISDYLWQAKENSLISFVKCLIVNNRKIVLIVLILEITLKPN